jgi:YHS domain-containing protein/thiol-disulfide isomerase/thioredoxin
MQTTLTAFLLPGILVATDTGPIKWRSDFRAAAIEAQQQNKLLVISIHASWCGPCREMDRTVFRDPKLAEILNRDCVPLSIDGDANKKLLADWGVTQFPTQMIIGTSGAIRSKVLERLEGRTGVAEYMEALQRCQRKLALATPKTTRRDDAVLPASATMPHRPAAHDQPSTTSATIRNNPNPNQPSMPKQSVDRSEEAPARTLPRSNPTAEIALALEGYCPVCMIEDGKMVPGKSTESVVYEGKRYHFATPEQKQTFLGNPKKYLPGAGGNCVVSLIEEGKTVEGKTKYPALFADRVFFLSDEQKRNQFLKDPERYVTTKGEPRTGPKE